MIKLLFILFFASFINGAIKDKTNIDIVDNVITSYPNLVALLLTAGILYLVIKLFLRRK